MTGATPEPETLTQRHVGGAHLYATRDDALDALPTGGRVAEVGVAFGDFSQRMIERLAPSVFDAYDIFRLHEVEVIWGQPSANTFKGRTHRKYYEDRFSPLLSTGQVRVYEGDSSRRLMEQPDGFYDVIYIDGNHSYEGVTRDAEAALLKIKPTGYLVFNDYIMMDHTTNDPYGIVPVVNDLCVNRGWRVHYLALQRHLFCDICLVRRDVA